MKRADAWLWGAAGLAYALLYVPLAVVVLFSFNDSELNASWAGFTLRWYGTLLHDRDLLAAAGNSLLIALCSAALSTVLGTLAGLVLARYRVRLLPALLMASVAMPEILLGVALLLFFRQVLDLTLGFWSILVAHLTFSVGAVALIVHARLVDMDASLAEAARDLGASPWATLRHVTLPPAMPAIGAGFLVAFTLSIDDFVITFFNAGVGTRTLPLQIYSMIKVAVTPEVNAVSTMLMAVTLSLVAIAARLAPGLHGSLRAHGLKLR